KPHSFDVILREPPVSPRLEVAEVQLLLQPELDATDRARNLAADERFPPARGFVVEEDAVDRMEAICLAVIDRRPVGKDLGARVWAARMEGRLFVLRRRRASEHLGGAGLVEARLL